MSTSRSVKLTVTAQLGRSMVDASELPEGPCSDAITGHVRTGLF